MENQEKQQRTKTNKGKKYKKRTGILSLSQAKQILPDDFNNIGLDPKEYRFLAAYCASGFNNPIEAYKKSGYKATGYNSQRVMANRLLNRTKVQEGIKRFLQIALAPFADQIKYNVLEVYYRRAFYTLDTFYTDTGELKPISEIPDEWQVCLDGLDKKKNYFKGELTNVQTEYKLANRDNALQMLWKYVSAAKDMKKTKLPSESRKKIEKLFNEGKIKPFNMIKMKKAE